MTSNFAENKAYAAGSGVDINPPLLLRLVLIFELSSDIEPPLLLRLPRDR